MSSESAQVLISLLFPLVILVVTYLIGAMLERRHFADLRVREERFRSFPTVTFATLPAGWEPTAVDVAHGSVVVSLDYFKRFIATLRALIGGRIKSYEPLLDRARREASLRMIEDATRRGFHAVVNVRLETSRMASARRDGKGTAGIEILAYGTALKLANPPA